MRNSTRHAIGLRRFGRGGQGGGGGSPPTPPNVSFFTHPGTLIDDVGCLADASPNNHQASFGQGTRAMTGGKFNKGQLLGNGGASSIIKIPDDITLSPEGEDHTLAFWVASGTEPTGVVDLIGKWKEAGDKREYRVQYDPATKILDYTISTTGLNEILVASFDVDTDGSALFDGSFHHVEVGRIGDVYRLFVGGNEGSVSNTQAGDIFEGNAKFTIFGVDDNTQHFDGGISEIILVKGEGGHSADFTPATEPFDYDDTPCTPPTSAGAHDFWRLYHELGSGAGVVTLLEVELFEDLGGPDTTSPADAVDAHVTSGFNSAGQEGHNAFDDIELQAANAWWVSDTVPAWIGWDYGEADTSPTDVKQVTMTTRWTTPSQQPADARIDYSDDGVNWLTAWTPGLLGGFASNPPVRRVFTHPGQLTGDALDPTEYTVVEGVDPGAVTLETVGGKLHFAMANDVAGGGKVMIKPSILISGEGGELDRSTVGVCFKISDHANFDDDNCQVGFGVQDGTYFSMMGAVTQATNADGMGGVSKSDGWTLNSATGWNEPYTEGDFDGILPTKTVPFYIGVLITQAGRIRTYVGNDVTKLWTATVDDAGIILPSPGDYGLCLSTLDGSAALDVTFEEIYWDWQGVNWPFFS